MNQLNFPTTINNPYTIDDYFFSTSNNELQDFLNNIKISWGYEPYKYSVLLSGARMSGKTHFSNIVKNLKSDLMIIDNMNEFDESELFHIFNDSNEKKQPVLFIGSIASIKLPDLKSRLASIKTLNIHHPDDLMMQYLIAKGFSKRSIKISEDVIKFLMNRVSREFLAIEQAIDLIDIQSLRQKRNVNIAFLSSLF
jgi:chromosomal replication initiation ATPase DnaA